MSNFICLSLIIIGSIYMTKRSISDFRQDEDEEKNNKKGSIWFYLVWSFAFATLESKLRWVVLLAYCIYMVVLDIALFVLVQFGFIKDMNARKIFKSGSILLCLAAVVVIYYILRHTS